MRTAFSAALGALCFLQFAPAVLALSDHIVISEVVVDVTGAESAGEFVELYNPTGDSISIGSWDIAYKSAGGSSWTSVASIPSGRVIGPFGFFLVGGDGVSPAPDYVDTSLGFSSSGGHVAVRNSSNQVIDRVGYGSAIDPEGTAAVVPETDESLERKPGAADSAKGNGQDGDNNAADFDTRATTEPQNSSSSAERPDSVLAVVSAVVPVLRGLSATTNITVTDADRNNKAGASETVSVKATSLADPAGITVVLQELSVSSANFDAVTAGGGVGVTLGASNAAARLLKVRASGDTITISHRDPASAETVVVIVRFAGVGAVIINEVLFDPTGADQGGEWVELYNADTVSVDVGDWTLTDEDASQVMEMPSGVVLPPDAFLLWYVDASGTNDTDFADGAGSVYSGETTTVFLTNTNDQVSLYASEARDLSTIVDFVQYSTTGSISEPGDANASVAAGIWPDSSAFVNAASLIEGQSIGLILDGADHNLVADWRIDSPTPGTGPTAGPNAWYVNDNSRSGDSFTQAVGSDANTGITPSSPKATMTAVTEYWSAGDTVFVDAGTYALSAGIVLNHDGLSIVGVESNVTVFTASNEISIFWVSGNRGIRIRDIGMSSEDIGVGLENASDVLIERVSVEAPYDYAVYGDSVSDVTVRGLGCVLANIHGVHFNNSTRLIVEQSGFSNGKSAFSMFNVTNSRFSENEIYSGTYNAFEILNSSNSNIFRGNRVIGKPKSFYLENATSNAFTGNDIHGNNAARIGAGSGNAFTGNRIDAGSFDFISGTGDHIIEKNNLLNLGAYYIDGAPPAATDFTRNWWGTPDSGIIAGRIAPGIRENIDYIPFRLGMADTFATGDSVAPRAPDSVSARAISTSEIRVSWTAATASEEPEPVLGLAGYRVYRSPTPDTTLWIQTGEVGPGVTEWVDNGLSPGETRYYVVTAFDNASPYHNESYFSDSVGVGRSKVPLEPPVVDTAIGWIAEWNGDVTGDWNDTRLDIFVLEDRSNVPDGYGGKLTYVIRRDSQGNTLVWADSSGVFFIDTGGQIRVIRDFRNRNYSFGPRINYGLILDPSLTMMIISDAVSEMNDSEVDSATSVFTLVDYYGNVLFQHIRSTPPFDTPFVKTIMPSKYGDMAVEIAEDEERGFVEIWRSDGSFVAALPATVEEYFWSRDGEYLYYKYYPAPYPSETVSLESVVYDRNGQIVP